MNHGPLEDFTEALADVQAENARLHRLIADAASQLEQYAAALPEWKPADRELDAACRATAFKRYAASLRLQAAKIAGVRAPVAHPALAHDLGGEG